MTFISGFIHDMNITSDKDEPLINTQTLLIKSHITLS